MNVNLRLAFVLILLATPLFAQKVKVESDPDYAFAEVHTYAWTELEQRDPSAEVHEQILAALESRLGETRLREAPEGASPDIRLTYRSSSQSTLEIDVTGLSDAERALIAESGASFPRGTLVLEARDAATGKLVYRGVAREAVVAKEPADLAKRIDKACKKLVEELWDLVYETVPDLRRFEGRPVTAIDLFGYKKTRRYIIEREVRVPVGEPLDLSIVDADVVRLDNLRIFAQTRVDAEEDGEGVRLDYQFSELPAAIPYPSVSYNEENGFSVGGGVSGSNVLGRDIRLSAKAMFGGVSNVNLYFEYPWITGNHFSVGLIGAHLERTDETRGFEEKSDEITPWIGSYFAGDRGRLYLGFSLFRMQSDVDGITLGEDNEDQLHRLGFAVGWDTRDSWTLPHRGWFGDLQVLRAGGILGGEGDFWTVDLDARRFQPLGSEDRTLVLASLLSLQSGEAFVDVPAYLRYHLGGANSIRGYAVDDLPTRLSGKNQYLGTVELRQTIMRPRRFKIFKWSVAFGIGLAALGDLGYAWDDDFDWNGFRGGVGAGVRLLRARGGMTRLDFGWSRDGGFQIHFGGGDKLNRQRLRIR